MTAFWAPHTVGGRPQCGLDTGAGTCAGTGVAKPISHIPGLVQGGRFRGEGLENEWKSRNGGFNDGKVDSVPYPGHRKMKKLCFCGEFKH